LFAGSQDVDVSEFDSLTQGFENSGPAEEAIRNRFRLARDRVLREKIRKQREQEAEARKRVEDAEKQARENERAERAEAWEKAQPELAALTAELEALAESAEIKTAERRLREIQARTKILAASAPDAETEILEKQRGAVDRLRETLDWHRWSNLRRKQDICAQLETLPSKDPSQWKRM
jgi:hypothetical protein